MNTREPNAQPGDDWGVTPRRCDRQTLFAGPVAVAAVLFGMSALAGCGANARHVDIASAFAVDTSRPESPHAADSAASRATGTLQVNAPLHGFGVVPCASRREIGFSVTNHGDREAVVARFRVSCDCLTVNIARLTILPNETVPGRLAVDLTAEPEWQGKLLFEVDAIDAEEHSLTSFCVPAEVRPRTRGPEEI